jgi:hypothetical protein
MSKMNINRYSTLFLFFLGTLFSHPAMSIEGKVTNNKGEIVPNAQITFVNSKDTTLIYTVFSDVNGNYSVQLPLNEYENQVEFLMFNNYPNPFSSGIIIPFYIAAYGPVRVVIYNVIGQEIAVPFEGNLPSGVHQIQWNGIKHNGQPVKHGIYFTCVQYRGMQQLKKIINITHDLSGDMPTPVPNEFFLTEFTPINYNITVQATQHNTLKLFNVSFVQTEVQNFLLTKISPVPFATVGNYLGIENNEGVYEPFFINGVNLGVGVPGTHPGEMAATREQYREWFVQMADVGFNSIRVYTLHFPRFYEELAYYNTMNPDKPIYLFHGVWLDEDEPEGNFYTFSEVFDEDIMEVVDCVHGNRFVPERAGRAFGLYETDVSQWVMAYIIGREVFPTEIFLTDSLSPSQTSFFGNAFGISNASPTEVWFTQRLNKLVTYERNTYGVERPVSNSSWPTLDPLYHPDDTSEDTAQIDLSYLILANAPAGYFASYHAYPYYPDFISDQANYHTYSDEYGPNSYVGYLTELKSHYSNIPLIIAEYGVPSSWGIASYAHSGMNHGGQDEVQQGVDNVRLIKNIHSTGCGGGFVFAWIDEWFKTFWITNPIGSSPDRRLLWNNKLSGEENFGLIAFDVPPPSFAVWPPVESNCYINEVNADYSHDFFHIQLKVNSLLQSGDTIWIGIDTYNKNLGELVLPNGDYVNNRAEFALEITPNNSQLYVTEAYNLFGIYEKHNASSPQQLYHSIPTEGAPWYIVTWKNGLKDTDIANIGNLRTRHYFQPPSSKDAVVLYPDKITIRIPWTLLNYTDPSMREVMDDLRWTPQRETAISDGIALTVISSNCYIETQRYIWPQWHEAPATTERKKSSYYIMKQGIESNDFVPY